MHPMTEAIESGDFEKMKEAVQTAEFTPPKPIRSISDIADRWDPTTIPDSWADIVVGAVLQKKLTIEQYAELAKMYQDRMAEGAQV